MQRLEPKQTDFPFFPFCLETLSVKEKKQMIAVWFPWGCSNINRNVVPDGASVISIQLPLTNIGLAIKYGLMPVSAEGFAWLQRSLKSRKVVFAVSDEESNLMGLAECIEVDPNRTFKYWLVGKLPFAGIVQVQFFAVGMCSSIIANQLYSDLRALTNQLNSTQLREAVFLQAADHETILRNNFNKATPSQQQQLHQYFQNNLYQLKVYLSKAKQ